MIRTGVPVSSWEKEGDAVIVTALEVMSATSEEDEVIEVPAGSIDPYDPSTVPEAWR